MGIVFPLRLVLVSKFGPGDEIQEQEQPRIFGVRARIDNALSIGAARVHKLHFELQKVPSL